MENEFWLSRMSELSPDQITVFIKILNFENVETLTWDLDQVLSNSEKLITQAYFEETRIDYRYLLLDQSSALSQWTFEDFLMPLEQAREIEHRIWGNASILAKASPNPQLIEYSRKAISLGIEQYIVTSRPGDLAHHEATLNFRERYCSWILPANIFIRDEDDTTKGDIYKAEIVENIQPDVHFEDDPEHAKEILARTKKTIVVLFSRSAERGLVIDDRIIEIPGIDVFGDAYRFFHKKMR